MLSSKKSFLIVSLILLSCFSKISCSQVPIENAEKIMPSQVLVHKQRQAIHKYQQNKKSLDYDSESQYDEADDYLSEQVYPLSVALRRQILSNSSDQIVQISAALRSGEGIWAIIHGKPGTAKSTIAQALAEESGRPVKYTNGGRFTTKYVQSGTKNIEKALEPFIRKHKDKNPIIIINEIDLLRSYENNDNHPSYALARLKDQYPNVAVIGTTSNLQEWQDTDPACVDRFSLRVKAEAPTKNERLMVIEECCQQYTENLIRLSVTDKERLASLTADCTHRDITQIFEEAISTSNVHAERLILEQSSGAAPADTHPVSISELKAAYLKIKEEKKAEQSTLQKVNKLAVLMGKQFATGALYGAVAALTTLFICDLMKGRSGSMLKVALKTVKLATKAAMYLCAGTSVILGLSKNYFCKPLERTVWQKITRVPQTTQYLMHKQLLTHMAKASAQRALTATKGCQIL